MHEYEVELLMTLEAESHEAAVAQATAIVDDGGGYRLGWRVRDVHDSRDASRFIDAETLDYDALNPA